jgi:hypothetical protein
MQKLFGDSEVDNEGGLNYTKKILKNVGCDDVEWSHVTRKRIQCRVM